MPTTLRRSFLDTIVKRYQGTQLGRQELDGEIIEDAPDALWTRALLEACRVDGRAGLLAHRGGGRSAGARGQGRRRLRAGRSRARMDGLVYVLADESAAGLSPAGWASKAIALWRRLEADALVVEVNQGGDMVRAVIRRGRRERAGDARCGRTRGK